MLHNRGGGRLCPSILVFFTLLYVIGGVKLGGTVYEQKTAKFGPQPGNYDLNAPSALAVPIDACNEIKEDLSGKIALIDRGGTACYFVDKTWHAQQAKAVGVIVGAVKPDTALLTMYAKDNSPHNIDIPAVFVTKKTMDKLKENVGAEVTMSEEGEQESYYDPLHWEFAKSFLVVLPIIFIAACCCYMILKYVKRAIAAFRRTENARRLPTVPYKQGEIINHSCCICIEDFEQNESTKVLPCGHGYHPACIDEWLTDHSDLCPMCKRSIFLEPTHPMGTRSRCDRIKAFFNCRYWCPNMRRRTPGPRLLSGQEQNAVQAV